MISDNKRKQPFRVWYIYLQTCLNDTSLSKNIDKNYYRNWNLNLIKSKYKLKRKKKGEKSYRLTDYPFDKWWEKHKELFTTVDKSQIKLFDKTRTPNTILVEVPKSFNVQRVQKEIGKVLKGRININYNKYKIDSNRPLMYKPLEVFLNCWKLKKENKYTLVEIWEKVSKDIEDRQSKVKKQVTSYYKTGKGIRPRIMSGRLHEEGEGYKQSLISKNISKGNKILLNVCKGIFPGDYTDHKK